nr:bromodomain-containing protein DDB_G0280777-like isoform X1 [Lytechinus pictus]
MSGADSDSTNLWDSSASESASLSTSVSANSSLNMPLFSTGKNERWQSWSTDESISCTSSLKPPSLSHTESKKGLSPSQSVSQASNTSQQPLPQAMVTQPSSAPGMFPPNNGPPQEQPASSDSNLTPQQITVIQLKLQEQLMMRHHKLQDAILLQQQELQQVQQQLMTAQQLMMQHHPMLGQMFIQQQEQLMGSKTPPVGGAGQATPSNASVQQLEPPRIQQPPHSSQHPQQLPQQQQRHTPQPTSHEALSMEQLAQHQLSTGAMWPCNTPNLLDLPSYALQSATRAPFAMHHAHQYPSTSGQSSHREHLTPHRTNNNAPPHQQVGPPPPQQQSPPPPPPHHPQQSLNCHSSLPQPTMHSSMTMPPGAQAVPMQDLSCLGLPTLDMGNDQYMQQSEGQDTL